MASEDLFSETFSEEIQKLNNEIVIEVAEAVDNQIQEPTNLETEATDNQEHIPTNDEEATSSNTTTAHQNTDKPTENSTNDTKLIQVPLSRIRALMKLDPDLNIASAEAVFAVAKATEMFIESLARESYTFTAQSKKKTIQKRDVDMTITSVDSLMFLEGAMNF